MNVMLKKSEKQLKIKKYLFKKKKKKSLSLANVYTLIYKWCLATAKGIRRPCRG